MIAAQLLEPLRLQIARRKLMHEEDLANGRGAVWLPEALSVKYPAAPLALGWQYVFAAPGFSVDPRSGAVRRHHVDEKRIQRAVKRAAAQAGIFKMVSPHTLPPFVCHSPAGRRLRHPYRTGVIGSLRCFDDDDIHACAQSRRARCGQPAGSLVHRVNRAASQ